MNDICIFDPVKEINEVRNQISVSKRMGFFFGAGTSMALGMPGIESLTEQVMNNIEIEYREQIKKIILDLKKEDMAKKITIEDILNHIRLIRQITREHHERCYRDIDGCNAKNLDSQICNKIYEILSYKENEITDGQNKLKITQKFFAWLNLLGRDHAKEVFTANYDLLFEKALEILQLPYFDGFIGAYEPFFVAESIEKGGDLREYPPFSWIRIWKVHGSLGWFWKSNPKSSGYRVIRLGKQAKNDTLNELVIYPSREKYESSRKQPFTAYLDRMKHHISEGEGIFIISGYSFADDHINDIIFNGLRHNNRLHIMAFLFRDDELHNIKDHVKCNLNMSVFSPTEAIIGGNHGKWHAVSTDNATELTSYWNIDKGELLLGDFIKLVNFLVDTSGRKKIIERELEVKNEK